MITITMNGHPITVVTFDQTRFAGWKDGKYFVGTPTHVDGKVWTTATYVQTVNALEGEGTVNVTVVDGMELDEGGFSKWLFKK